MRPTPAALSASSQPVVRVVDAPRPLFPHVGSTRRGNRRYLCCEALPDAAAGVAQALSSFPPLSPAAVAAMASDSSEQLLQLGQDLQPHFGTRAISGVVEALTAQVAPALPSLPSVQLPELPSVSGLGALGAGGSTAAGAGAGSGAAGADGGLVAVAGAVQSSVTSALSSLQSLSSSGPAPPSADSLSSLLPADLSAALSAPAAAALAAAGLDPAAPLPPHFGTAAVAAGVEALAGWAGGRFQGLELYDSAAAAALGSALDELRSVAGLMTLPPAPSLGAAGSDTLAALGATATALSAAFRGVEGGAAEGAEALVAAVAAAAQQAATNGIGGHSPVTVALVSALGLLAIAASTPGPDYEGPASPSDGADGGLQYEYDPEAAAAYWARRPLAVASRSAQVAAEAASFGAALLLDLWTGRLQANEQQRAEQLRGVIERLGPAYVKVAQALSTRVDLLSPAYFAQVQLLQDRVPPFPCEVAKAEMDKAFGRPVGEVFSSLSDKPVAAASLGQVYRATLRLEYGGGEVAVKVQRPGVLEQVSLDLLIMRRLAIVMKEQLQMNTDWAAVIDAWAVRFLHEMDYGREADNAELFASQMAAAGVTGVTVAAVQRGLSSRSVLTTTWVDGEKLSESTASDVRELCNTLLNAYLIQLLDTGFLHADPHPGNLIRTPDGKICVLDFGLMTEVTPEQRVALVEYIAHLSTQDWEKLALDLQTLGFIPPEVDTQQAGLVEPLGRVMSQLVGGGGASKVNIDKVMADLDALGEMYPIQVPPFFALILRAFSVIEGIALRVDPDYAIVAECFPYLARRLLNDDSPRMRAVLKDILYGNRTRMDVERLLRVADGLAAYTTEGLAEQGGAAAAAVAAAVAAAGQQQLRRGPAAAALPAATADKEVLSPVVVDTLRSVLRPGSYVSELMVEELVAAVDALSRDALSRLVGGLLLSGPAAAAQRGVQALGPLRPVLLPLPTPVEVLDRLAPAVAVTPEDQEALGVVRGLLAIAQRLAQAEAQATAAAAPAAAAVGAGVPPPSAAAVRSQRAVRLARELGVLAPELAPGLAYTGDLLMRALTRRLQARMREAVALAGVGSLRAGGAEGSGRAAGAAAAAAVGAGVGGGVGSGVPQPAIAMRMMGPPRGGQGAGAAQGSAGQRGSGR